MGKKDDILRLRNQGWSYTKIAGYLSTNKTYVARVCRKNECGGYGLKYREELIVNVAPNISKCGYEYIGGYTDSRHPVKIKCRECGCVFERVYHDFITVLNGSIKGYTSIKCPECADIQKAKERMENQAAKERIRAEREARKAEEQKKRAAIEEQKNVNKLVEQFEMHTCKNCGEVFCMAVTGYKSTMYCSLRCMKRYNERIKNDVRLERIKKTDMDSGITLEKVYKNDNGICYLCNKPCDWNDISERNGALVAGLKYPSVEHVIPISKGGTHTWNNVRLACRECNSIKGIDVYVANISAI